MIFKIYCLDICIHFLFCMQWYAPVKIIYFFYIRSLNNNIVPNLTKCLSVVCSGCMILHMKLFDVSSVLCNKIDMLNLLINGQNNGQGHSANQKKAGFKQDFVIVQNFSNRTNSKQEKIRIPFCLQNCGFFGERSSNKVTK